jgi:hypothetical protein
MFKKKLTELTCYSRELQDNEMDLIDVGKPRHRRDIKMHNFTIKSSKFCENLFHEKTVDNEINSISNNECLLTRANTEEDRNKYQTIVFEKEKGENHLNGNKVTNIANDNKHRLVCKNFVNNGNFLEMSEEKIAKLPSRKSNY